MRHTEHAKCEGRQSLQIRRETKDLHIFAHSGTQDMLSARAAKALEKTKEMTVMHICGTQDTAGAPFRQTASTHERETKDLHNFDHWGAQDPQASSGAVNILNIDSTEDA